MLARAGAARARSIVFASGDDPANLEGAVAAYDWLRREAGTSLVIWAHVANERLVKTARSALRTGSGIDIRFLEESGGVGEPKRAGNGRGIRRAGLRDGGADVVREANSLSSLAPMSGV